MTILASLLLSAVPFINGCARQTAEAASRPNDISAPPSPPIKPAPATPIQTARVELGGPRWDPQWDAIVEKALPEEMLSSEVPHDVRRFCPRFSVMSDTDKRAFWAYFFQALAGAEAGLYPGTRVRHTEPAVAVIDPVTHRMVRSEGLLQLTYEDSQRYGCDFDWDADRNLDPKDQARTILRPKNNLECGVKILDHQIIEERRSLISPYSYWSTLQPGTVSYRVFAKQMTNPPLACGLAAHNRRVKSAAPKESAREIASR